MDQKRAFAQSLSELIRAQGGASSRRNLVAALGISPATLSQYTTGGSTPSFERLLGLSEALGVSLDELVYGRSRRGREELDPGPWERAIDARLARLKRSADLHTEVSQRIGQELSRRVEEAASAVAGRLRGAPGLIDDDEGLLIESHSLHTRTLALRMDWGVTRDASDEGVPGRFLMTMARNLAAGRRYDFVLARESRDAWQRTVGDLRQLLRQCGLEAGELSRCSFLWAEVPAPTGVVLYELDLSGLARQEPLLLDRLRPQLSEDGWLGAVQPPSSDLQADMVMDQSHLAHARKLFEALGRRKGGKQL